MSRLLHDLGLKEIAVALEQSLARLDGLADRMTAVRGVSQSMALEAQEVMPGFLNKKRPVGFFTVSPSQTQYRVSLEEISRGMWSAIAIGIAAAFAAVIGLIMGLVGGDSGGAKSPSGTAKTPPIEKAIENAEKVTAVVQASEQAAEVIQHTRDHVVDDAIKKAFAAQFMGKAMEDIQTHSHASISTFSELDRDMLMQSGIYALLHSDKDLAPTVRTLLRPAINDSDRIVDEFEKRVPDYKAVAESIKRMQDNRAINGNYEDGISFVEYVNMLVEHRNNNSGELKLTRIGDFTELVRGMRQFSEKNLAFFKDLLRRNGDILEDLAHEAKHLSKRASSVQAGVSQGTQEDARTLVKESQKFIMETCQALRSLGSYVHLTIWCANRHAKFVMFLNNSLKDILLAAKAYIKKKGYEVPDYFEEAIQSLGKSK